MSRLGCKCGAVMTYTDCPSPCILKIFLKSDVDRAVAENPSLRWMDLESDWDDAKQCKKEYSSLPYPAEFWFCPECKRVYVIDQRYNRWSKVYKPDSSAQMPDDSEWSEILVFHDAETDAATDADINLTVKDYAYTRPLPRRVYLAPDKASAVVHEGEKATCYILEDSWSPEG